MLILVPIFSLFITAIFICWRRKDYSLAAIHSLSVVLLGIIEIYLLRGL